MWGIIVLWTSKLIAFLISYILLSRVFSIPFALTLQFPHYVVFLMVFGLDVLQIPLFYKIYKKGFPQVKFIRRFLQRLPTSEQVEKSRLGRIAQHLGGLGLVFISAVPTFGGGIWSAVLFAHLFPIGQKRSFIYIALGSFISCIALVYGFNAIFNVIGLV